MDSVTAEFLDARAGFINSALLSETELERLREKIDQSLAGSTFCDGCGFCCVDHVAMIRTEYERVEQLVRADASLLTLQGHVCPFLDLDRETFEADLENYGKVRISRRAMRCRVYHERPLTCRMYPAPESGSCRPFEMLKVPDINEALLEPDREDFPELLIQSYYLTLRWESLNTPQNVFDANVLFHLMPGWIIDDQNNELRSSDGPHWLSSFIPIPKAFPVPDTSEMEPWAVEALQCLQKPTSYPDMVKRLEGRCDMAELGMMVGQAEIAAMVVPVDVALRSQPARSYLRWQSG